MRRFFSAVVQNKADHAKCSFADWFYSECQTIEADGSGKIFILVFNNHTVIITVLL